MSFMLLNIEYLCERVVIPFSMRAEVLKKVHERPFGIEKCKARARASMYWPGMTNDIEEMIANVPRMLNSNPGTRKKHACHMTSQTVHGPRLGPIFSFLVADHI